MTELFNEYWRKKKPFVFIIDFELKKPKIWPLPSNEILFEFNSKGNNKPIELATEPIPFDTYKTKFDVVMDHLLYGDSFITNLTIKTKINLNVSLRDVFYACSARYKILTDNFLCFSPETFIRIEDNVISTYPMKGTIDASIPNAEAKILSDQKELAEHVTIVDLLRNDLSMIADNVPRYKISLRRTSQKLIASELGDQRKVVAIIRTRSGWLPVITIARRLYQRRPKRKTIEVIRQAEGEERGYYTGICGYFDGHTLDSGVMIRFIEQTNSDLYYRSGGGITTQSDVSLEYQEALDKIYVPTN
ncbi:MAG: aminodeoxychorismate synthase component I [Bacteroidota bacterium]